MLVFQFVIVACELESKSWESATEFSNKEAEVPEGEYKRKYKIKRKMHLKELIRLPTLAGVQYWNCVHFALSHFPLSITEASF